VEPIDNLEEEPGRTVGRRKPPSDPLSVKGSNKAATKRWAKALKSTRIPRGVYRFESHEEADEWLWKMITRKTD
jgi:hypothetical protein